MVRLEGYVDHIIFRNEENGYTVFELIPTPGEDEKKGKTGRGKENAGNASEDPGITCTGNVTSLHEGETVRLEGTYTMHPAYGQQFRVTDCEEVEPSSAIAMER